MNKINRLKEIKKNRKKFIISIILIDLFLIILMYFIMPKVQLFPPYSENLAFQEKVQPMTHIEQYSIIFIFGCSVHLLSFKLVMRNINKYIKKYINNENIEYNYILKIRKECQNIPYKLLIIEWSLFVGIGIVFNFIMLVQAIAIIKFTLMIIALVSLIVLCSFIATKKYLDRILYTTYIINKEYNKHNGMRINTHFSLLIQSFPLVFSMLVIPLLLGYSSTVQQKGLGIASYYKAYLNEKNYSNIRNMDDLKEILDNIPLYANDNYYFIIEPNDTNIYTSNPSGEISSFVLDYRDFFFTGNEGMLYEEFGVDEQLYTKKILDNNNRIWYIGFKFPVTDMSILVYDINIIIFVLLATLIFIYIWAKSFNKNSKRISTRLKEILDNNKIDRNEIIPLMSNDELSDLSYYYNEIQKKLIHQSDIIALQSRFSAIGEVAAGMAHDINNPASSLDTSIDLLANFKVEDKQEQYKKLVENMKISNDKILKIVNNTQNQFRNISDKTKTKFSLSDILNQLCANEKEEFSKISGNINIKVEKEIIIYGVENKLYQVIMNIVRNAMLTYKEREITGSIDISVYEENNINIISITDKAGGIPEEIQDTLFTKILTTRGSKGTGLGLYLASNIIREDFDGEISFDSVTGVGTTFYIKIPKNKED